MFPPIVNCIQEPALADRLHFGEGFAGDQNWSSGMRLFGYTGLSIDKRYNTLHDFMMPAGFLVVLAAAWKIIPKGWFHFAPPCANWILLCRGSTGRRAGDNNEWRGRSDLPKCTYNNKLVSRLCHILWLLSKRGVYWTIEQPDSSLMLQHSRLKNLIQRTGAKQIHFDMGHYGARSVKKTILVGTVPWLDKLQRKLTSDQKQALSQGAEEFHVTKRYKDKDGKPCFSGGKDLKKTQSYPPGLGSASGLCP